MKAKSPNIIFILSDQHNASVIGALGDKVVKTPNLDRLAQNGTSFADCNCASPLCVPSRMSMMTGQLPTQTGVFNNSQSLRFEQPTFAYSLAAAGYSTVLCGRMHFVGDDQHHGFQNRLVGDFTASHLKPMIENPLGSLCGADGPSLTSVEKSGAGGSSVLAYDQDVIDAARSYIKAYDDDSPLLLTVGLYGPHCPYVCPQELFDYYKDKVSADEDIDHMRQIAHPAIKKWYENRGVQNVTEQDVLRVKAAYYGMITHMDSLIGDLLNCVDDALDPDNTIIIYGSDHGDCMGDNGLFWKTNFYEGSVKVPLIFSAPSLFESGRVLSAPTSLADLAPTLCDIAGAPRLPNTFGQSLLPALCGTAPQEYDRVIISQLADTKGDAPSAMIKHGGFKLVKHIGYDDVQLFNLADDPKEKRDIGTDERFAQIRNALLSILADYWDETQVMQTYHEDERKRKIIFDSLDKYDFDDAYDWKAKPEQNYLIDSEKTQNYN